MKHYLLLFIITFTTQAQNILWEKSYGGKHAEILSDAIPTPDYGFILAGSSISSKNGNKKTDNKGDLDYWVWKMDEKGDLDWQKSFGGAGVDMLQSIKLTQDAGFILAGTSTSNKGQDKNEDSKGDADFWIIKLDAKGGEMWQKTIGGAGQEKLQCIVRTKDGGYLLGGSSSSDKTDADAFGLPDKYGKTEDSHGNLDYWVVKLKEDGTIAWQKTIGGDYIDELKSVAQTTDGGYILGGYSNSPISGDKTQDNFGIGDYWIVKLDSLGNIQWQKTVGGDQDDNLFALTQTQDGGFIAGGNSNSEATKSKTVSNGRGTDFWVVKFNHLGDITWQQTYNYGETDILTTILENNDGTFLIGGYARKEVGSEKLEAGKKEEDKGLNDYIALKITANGEEIWTKTIGSAGEDILKKLLETRDGGYLLAGTSNPQAVSNGSGILGGSGKGAGINIGSQGGLLDAPVNDVNNAISNVGSDINNAVKDKVAGISETVNDAIKTVDTESRFKFGLNSPVAGIALPRLGSGGESGNNNPLESMAKLPPSGEKKNNLGNSDFWVVKLRDNSKPPKIKTKLEVLPNPAVTFTNVIVNFDYTSGDATLYDLNGRLLRQEPITGSHTIPIDLTGLPVGIYLIDIRTNNGNEGIKVIKQ